MPKHSFFKNLKGEEIDLQVLVYTRPNLRSYSNEMEMYMGFSVLQSIFTDMKVNPSVKTLYLAYPERWLNIIEQRQLFSRLSKYCPNLEEVTIKTHSVYIIQCTPNIQVGIVKLNGPLPSESDPLDAKLYIDSTQGNIFHEGKLTVL